MRIWRGTNGGGVWGLLYSLSAARLSPSTNISKHEAKCHLEREQTKIKHTEHHILSLSISGNGFSLAFNQRHTEVHYHPLRRVCSCGCVNCHTVYSKHWPLITSAFLKKNKKKNNLSANVGSVWLWIQRTVTLKRSTNINFLPLAFVLLFTGASHLNFSSSDVKDTEKRNKLKYIS